MDLWYTDHGASKFNGTKVHGTRADAVTDYEEYKFGQARTRTIRPSARPGATRGCCVRF